MDDEALLLLAARLAGQAAAAIEAVRHGGFDVRAKADASPVTQADLQAERIIVTGLRAASGIAVVAEEEVAAQPPAARQTVADEYWLVDPLDGTREFAAGRADYAVNVGLVRAGFPVLGVVAAPATGELYAGIVGRGAWKRTAGERRPITARKPGKALDVMASRHHADDPKLAEFLSRYDVSHVTNIGSALKFCRLAEGLADLYPRLETTMEWDTAAPQAVLEAAGGVVRTMDGARLGYGKPGWFNPPFLCTGG